jgi:type III pantothenate kinase
MRLITIDNGNTNPHVGIFHDEKLILVTPLKNYSPQKDDFVIISDVGSPLSFKPSFDLKTLRPKMANGRFFEMPVHYAETLGDDRLFSAYYVFQKLKNDKDLILVIDAGTFITMDFVGPKGFLGGYIFPGIKTFLKSYSTGALLPVMSETANDFQHLPHSTEEAISGAAHIYLDKILESIIKKASPSKIILTGGGLELLKNKIEKLSLKVQLETDPHLIHESLALLFRTHLQKA